eukprot:11389620-Heterocapsa_arctica.AAC.1
MLGVASTSAYISDAVLGVTLEDDRLPSRLAEIDESICEELDYIFGVSEEVWDCLGSAIGSNGAILRHESLTASLTSAGFFHMRVRYARRPPWSYCSGDTSASLDRLLAAGEPEEPCTRKLFHLHAAGSPQRHLEQGHAAASMMRRKHRDYELDSLQSPA